ncbi:MAG: glycosyltransferase [Sediminibacterium sp.]|nr:glycosyltransferase [Sediminibacterium sp.]
MKRGCIIIDATYINQSGGRILLELFIRRALESSKNSLFFYLFDKRLDPLVYSSLSKDSYMVLKPGEWSRLKAFNNLKRTKSIKSILSLNNLPPIIFGGYTVYIYFHNVFIIKTDGLGLPFRMRVGYNFKRLYIRLFNKKKYTWLTQTEGIENRFKSSFMYNDNRMMVLPFFDDRIDQNSIKRNKRSGFIYPATGVPSKNHLFLLEVWKILGTEYQTFPKLYLTVDCESYAPLCKEIERYTRVDNLNIENLGFISRSELQELYDRSEFLIYPSKDESFGLPLIEGALSGLKIIGPNIDYLNQIIGPTSFIDIYSTENAAHEIYRVIIGENVNESKIKIRNKIQELIAIL